jgi:GNAT superfamily N-acetyltransferase
VDPRAVLAAYDEQVRRRPAPDDGGWIERADGVIRTVGSWNGVGWADPEPGDVDAVIAAQVARFRALGRPWEWKHYSHDRTAGLPERLLAAGFTPEPPETLLVAETADLAPGAAPPAGVELRPVVDAHGVAALVAVHDDVFGGDHSAVGRVVSIGIANGTVAAVVALAGENPVSAGRVEFHPGTEFAGLWGGGTVDAWRGRGLFRALVAHRAAEAAARGYRYLQVDATAASRPILRRLGFVELATTTPYTHP